MSRISDLFSTGVLFITFGFLSPPPSVRSLVLRDVSLPGGVGEDRVLTRPGSRLPCATLRPEGPGTLAVSPGSAILWHQVLMWYVMEMLCVFGKAPHTTTRYRLRPTVVLCRYQTLFTWLLSDTVLQHNASLCRSDIYNKRQFRSTHARARTHTHTHTHTHN